MKIFTGQKSIKIVKDKTNIFSICIRKIRSRPSKTVKSK